MIQDTVAMRMNPFSDYYDIDDEIDEESFFDKESQGDEGEMEAWKTTSVPTSNTAIQRSGGGNCSCFRW